MVGELLNVMADHDECGVDELALPFTVSERMDRPRKRSATSFLAAALDPLFPEGEGYDPRTLARDYARPLVDVARERATVRYDRPRRRFRPAHYPDRAMPSDFAECDGPARA